MRWLLLIILLFPITSYAQEDALQLVEIGGFFAENLDSNNPKKFILASPSNNQISGGFTLEETNQDTLQLKNRKSPTAAFILSLVGGATILPGLGQHYNGEHNKGLCMGAVWFAGWGIAAGTVDRDSEKTGQAIGIPLVLTALIWSCIDAPISANKINKRLREQNTHEHMFEFSNDKYTLGLDLSITEKTIGPNLTLHF